MKIGQYEIYPIETGFFSLDGGAMFGIVPKTIWSKSNIPDEKNRLKLAVRSLLIIGNGKKILIDTGIGSKFLPKYLEIYDVDTNTFNLEKSLTALNIAKEEITDVIISHLHFDHAGGSTYLDGEKLKPTFPNARHHIQRTQWMQALNPTERDKASFMPEDYLPLRDYGLLELVDGECEIFPNISLLVMEGHTPGLQLVKISDSVKTLLYCADLIPLSSHIPLPYIMGFDLYPHKTLEEKKRILARAVEEDWICFFEHDPKIIAGKIIQTPKGYMLGSPVNFD